MRGKVTSRSVVQKCLRLVMLVGVLAVAGIPAQGMGALTAEAADTPINSTNFPDEIFRAYVSENFDTDGNGVLSDAEKDAVTSIDVRSKSISSMVGVENFKNLKELRCEWTKISGLDVSQNTALETLYCYYTQISSLDVSQNTALTGLYCSNTQLSSLDVSQNTALTWLNCSSTQISSLDVSQNTALTGVDYSSTQISSLDVSQNTALRELWCNNTQLSSLDVSQNTALTGLYCSNTQLSSLDVSQNTALIHLYCSNTQISSLDVSQNIALRYFQCNNNQFSNGTHFFDTTRLDGFDLSRASNWTNASISGTVVTAVDMSSPVTYIYNCGNKYSKTFTFIPTPVTYTVTFDANGGNCSTSSKSVTYGNSYGMLPTPTWTGYTFAGWYTSANGGSQVTSSTTVNTSSDHTLYAHWTANPYTVTFNANGGSCSQTSKSVTYGSSYGPLPTPTRIGYTFVGWYTSAIGGDRVTSDTTVSTSSDHTLYAHWTADTYTIAFDANEGSCSTTSKSVRYGSSYGTLPTPTRTGYTFAGWYTSASGGSQVTSSMTVSITSNQTLYAHWNPNPNYTVTFNANGGNCSTTSKSVTYGSSYGTLPTPTRTGYTFAGWYTSASGGNQVTSSTTVNTSSDHTLYAHWTANTYTVTFNANGGSCNTISKSVTYGKNYGTLLTPTRAGYTFAGWYTSTSGGSQVTSSTTVRITSNQTLYAHWAPNTNRYYTVTYNANGGSCGTSSKSVTYGNSYGTLPTPTRAGYTFAGWYTSLSGGNQVTISTIVSTASDHTLYAHWTLKPSSGNNTDPEETEKKDDNKTDDKKPTVVNPLASVKPKLKVKIAGANKVKLSWNKVKGVQKYHVYRATSKNGDYKLVKTLPKSKLKYTMGKLQSNRKYYFKLICSTVSAGQTMYSQETIVSKKVYGRPKTPQLTKVKEGTYVLLKWKKQKDIAKVMLMKNWNQSGWESLEENLNGKRTSYRLDPKLFLRGSKYQFRIRVYYIKDGVKIYSKFSNPVKLFL